MTKPKFIISIGVTCVLSACSSVEPQKATLRSIDQQQVISTTSGEQALRKKSTVEIRDAYKAYLSNSSKDDLSRRNALNRLAELEFEVSNENSQTQTENEEARVKFEEAQQTKKLNQTIELLTTSLTDYPKARGNDRLMYQLAKALDQNGDYFRSIEVLTQLVTQYPNSRYYVEAQFRLAESNFSQANYAKAENGYTEVLIAPGNQVFYEKAIFKRGWSRYKQSYYQDAVDDYVRAIQFHQFDNSKPLDSAEQNLFDEYFRALGLSFSGLGGSLAVKEFFDNSSEFEFQYATYSSLSDLYLKQERYSDAVQVLKQYISENKNSPQAAAAQLKTVKVWQQSRFTSKLNEEIELFYIHYNPSNRYWKNLGKESVAYKTSYNSLREYVLLAAGYFHSLQQKRPSPSRYSEAKKWYNRYLKDFASYARKDNVYSQYAQLLSSKKQYSDALNYYELAAYDGNLILDKESAYASIFVADKLYQSTTKPSKRTALLDKLINYSVLFAQLYREDPRTFDIVTHAIEVSYSVGNYRKTLELAEYIEPSMADTTKRSKAFYAVSLLKAQSYFNLDQFSAAEAVYSSLINTVSKGSKQYQDLIQRQARTVYSYANQLKNQNQLVEATKNYLRITEFARQSDIAVAGLYDAIALFMTNQSWSQAISAIKKMQSRYPNHKYSKDVTKKLSIAYLKSDQGLKAAEQFEKISSFENNKEVKMAALWQAAELYESKNNWLAAARSYTEYANTFKKPYPQYVEAMNKLVILYQKMSKSKLLTTWQKRIINADKKQTSNQRTSRTDFIVAKTNLEMARQAASSFEQHKLTEPLQKNLRAKKLAMQQAIKYYGEASNYGLAELTTESTYAIADIYLKFSRSLLDSERPKHLKGEDLEQYNILLEDQAFPFEDKAIEFHEINLSRIKGGTFNDWVSKSLSELKTLFPAKYDRKSKLEGYIDVL